MGEYAKFNGEKVKIGTCEDMYYLRADQRHLVEPIDGSLNPTSSEELEVIRFRFPFPEEDRQEPGEFENHCKTIGLYGVSVPDEVEHSKLQFVSQRGYLISLPCPESKEGQAMDFGKNGNPGPVRIVQQAFRNGNLALICECGGCGTKYNLPTLGDAQPVIDALQKDADNCRVQEEERKEYYLEVIRRIKAGYQQSETTETKKG